MGFGNRGTVITRSAERADLSRAFERIWALHFGGRPLVPEPPESPSRYRVEVKTPAELSGPWDVVKLVTAIAPEDALRSGDDGKCPLVRRSASGFSVLRGSVMAHVP